ncbi:hypothetical protein [Paraburkholderia rhizosphaerae]|uniref:hypothetical protein n=1 Tax=Paraburkholderia rhizosphaerae TaxID=480658 RepID=UPI001065844B|nr:hypothetical protein [Paraburkholderia rhizosphaerae]
MAVLTAAMVIALTTLWMERRAPGNRAQPAWQTASSGIVSPRAFPGADQAGAALFGRQATVDVLEQLAAPRATPWVPAATSQSATLSEAYQRAMEFPVFDSLASRKDPEGLFETAAWADACRQVEVHDATLRCGDSRLRDPAYAETVLARAAGTGQAGAILELAMRYPTSWNTISLGNGVMLDDALYMLAQHGNLRALDLLRQWCTLGNHCKEPTLTRNVLMLLMFRATGVSYQAADAASGFEGSAADIRRAESRAAQMGLLH